MRRRTRKLCAKVGLLSLGITTVTVWLAVDLRLAIGVAVTNVSAMGMFWLLGNDPDPGFLDRRDALDIGDVMGGSGTEGGS